MMSKVVQWIFESIGYILYGIVVLIVSLWLLFPADTVRKWLELKLGEIYPYTNWTVEKVGFVFPFKVKATNIRMQTGTSDDATAMTIDQFSVIPHYQYLSLKDARPYMYDATGLGGSVRGKIILYENSSFDGEATFTEVQMAKLGVLFQQVDRELSGTLSGSFTLKGEVDLPDQIEAAGTFSIDAGGFRFRNPVLGLERFDFSVLGSGFSLENRNLKLDDGKVESRLLSADFSGNISCAENVLESEMAISGAILPRPELFAVSQEAMLDQFVREQMQGDRLPFAITGLLVEPAISFSQYVQPDQGSDR